MSGSITAIIIQKNNFAKNIPLEECEKKEGTCVLRFQRPAAASALESFIRFFSDLREGVTKAKDKLCDLEGELPILISVKGHILITKEKDQFGHIQGKFTKTSKHLPVGAEEVPIFFRKSESSASQSAEPPSGEWKSINLPPPPPKLTMDEIAAFEKNDQPPSGKAPSTSGSEQPATPAKSSSSSPPSRPPPAIPIQLPTALQPITSEQLTALEQNLAPQNTRPPLTLPSEDNPPPMPPGFQSPATAPVLSLKVHDVPPPPPPAPLGGLTAPKNGSATEPGTSQDSKRPSLQSQNEAKKSPLEQMNDLIVKGVKLRRTGVNPEIKLEGDATSAPRSPIETLPLNFKQTASTSVLPQQAHDVAPPSEQLKELEQNHAPQHLPLQFSAPPKDYPPPLPPGFQRPAAPAVFQQPLAAPPPLDELSELKNVSAKPSSPAQVTTHTNLQPKQEATEPASPQMLDQIRRGDTLNKAEESAIRSKLENSTKTILSDQIKQGVPLRKAEVNPKKEPLGQANSAPQSIGEILINKLASIRNANNDVENEEEGGDWDEEP
jgi:hypothetical protein